ncbi:MAG TPA: UDP-N-acetyl-alpha-D-muramoyl-L-alanyl-L-glutamate epimerase [Rhodanobacteraceae bacterium]|nr:UDP-N-acetyl-alpha-D-muramoyl-L-alanyl-L-glutamate epimerase [Rhodanobacteraceae bacterium]
MTTLADPRQSRAFRFVRRHYAAGVAELVYAFDDGPELVERIRFPDVPALPAERAAALEAALELLHLVAGISYYKAGVPAGIDIDGTLPDADTAAFLHDLYLHGLGEFAWHNQLDLRGRIRFPHGPSAAPAAAIGLPARTLVPIGGGKDSLVSVELLKTAAVDATAVWIGSSELIRACAERSGLPRLNIGRELSPLLFDLNRQGALNGHIPVTAINSAILAVAAVLYGFNAIAFSNERSASSATLEYDGQPINHQWSKSRDFERAFHLRLNARVATDLDYYSLLRPLSELAVAARFARNAHYDAVFSSCNRNFRILGPKPADRWCGQCPKCHFVFLALAPFMPKPRLVGIFGRNLLDDDSQAAGFDALMEYHDHKPFECVGEASEARAAMAALASRAEWREDALVERFREVILPALDAGALALEPWLVAAGDNDVPAALRPLLDAYR